MIDTTSRPGVPAKRRQSQPGRQAPARPKRLLPLYIPRIMADLMWATTKNSTSMHFGLGHRCHKHGRMFDLEHLATCSEIQGCPDIARYAQRLKQGENIRLWPREELADAVLQYTQLALQLANLTATSRASLAQQVVKPKEKTGNKRGRPRASEVVARTNHKVDDFFLRKAQPAQRLETSPNGAAREEETKTPH